MMDTDWSQNLTLQHFVQWRSQNAENVFAKARQVKKMSDLLAAMLYYMCQNNLKIWMEDIFYQMWCSNLS